MYHSGIGGGGFMLVRSSNGSYEFIDFRETAPAAAFQDMYKGNINASLYGGLARYCPFPFFFYFPHVNFRERSISDPKFVRAPAIVSCALAAHIIRSGSAFHITRAQ